LTRNEAQLFKCVYIPPSEKARKDFLMCYTFCDHVMRVQVIAVLFHYVDVQFVQLKFILRIALV
jgi:hypothetical protein